MAWDIGAYKAAAGGGTLSITDIDVDDVVFDGQSAIITGTLFGVAQGQVLIGTVPQTITDWTDSQITITVVQGG